ncbi:MAG: hypothetical protein RIR18_1902 [Pseudomonadota bacterium]|jgi:hypothetical protein
MNTNLHSMTNLFSQLGLPNSPEEMDKFFELRRPLGNEVALYRASFWSESQRNFLKEEIIEDADWAMVIDEMNSLLH